MNLLDELSLLQVKVQRGGASMMTVLSHLQHISETLQALIRRASHSLQMWQKCALSVHEPRHVAAVRLSAAPAPWTVRYDITVGHSVTVQCASATHDGPPPGRAAPGCRGMMAPPSDHAVTVLR
eukprot:768463-Hanusia_phi.AAC.1